MDLKTAKLKIKIVSADENLNKRLQGMVLKATDCFGVDFISGHEECSRCVILADIDGRRLPLWNFCKEIVDEKNEKIEKERLRKIEIMEEKPIEEPKQMASPEVIAAVVPEEFTKEIIEKVKELYINPVVEPEPESGPVSMGLPWTEPKTEPTPVEKLPPLTIPKPKKPRKVKDPNENPNLKLKISPDIEEWTKQQILSGKKNREFASELESLLRKDPRVIEKNRNDIWIKKQGERVCWVVSRKHNLRPTNKDKRAKKV